MRLVEEIPLRWPSTEQRVRFAILCALDVYQDTEWRKWAAGWLSGRDRSNAVAALCRDSGAYAASRATRAAAYAARAAARAAALSLPAAADAAADAAAYAARRAADAAADAADADLVSAAHEAWL